jgi:hypothetical protein
LFLLCSVEMLSLFTRCGFNFIVQHRRRSPRHSLLETQHRDPVFVNTTPPQPQPLQPPPQSPCHRCVHRHTHLWGSAKCCIYLAAHILQPSYVASN